MWVQVVLVLKEVDGDDGDDDSSPDLDCTDCTKNLNGTACFGVSSMHDGNSLLLSNFFYFSFSVG